MMHGNCWVAVFLYRPIYRKMFSLTDLSLKKEITEAKSIAFHIPRQLEEARKFIVLAESEFKERMLDPFWDAIEEATKALAYYDQSLGRLNGNSKAYRQIQGAAKIHGIVIDPYPIGVSELPQGSELAQQLRTLGRSAQGSVEFTTIYHMRRTNAILISGFTTFGQALCEIGD